MLEELRDMHMDIFFYLHCSTKITWKQKNHKWKRKCGGLTRNVRDKLISMQKYIPEVWDQELTITGNLSCNKTDTVMGARTGKLHNILRIVRFWTFCQYQDNLEIVVTTSNGIQQYMIYLILLNGLTTSLNVTHWFHLKDYTACCWTSIHLITWV